MTYVFGIESKKSLPRLNLFALFNYSGYIIVLEFTFRSMTNFELWWTFVIILGVPG